MLAQKFEVSGIPTLVVLDGATGAIKDSTSFAIYVLQNLSFINHKFYVVSTTESARNTVAGAKGNVKTALAQWTA